MAIASVHGLDYGFAGHLTVRDPEFRLLQAGRDMFD
jgi:hypothetical protein